MGLSHGIVRFSIGLDQDRERTFQKMMACIEKTL
jgi:methionine-gamma-lyase